MKLSVKLLRARVIIVAMSILMGLGLASNLFVSLSQTEKQQGEAVDRNPGSEKEEEEGDPREREAYWEKRRGGISHVQIAEARKQAERLPQALALPNRTLSDESERESNMGINAVTPGGSPWVSFGPAPINFFGATFSGRVPTVVVDPVDPNTLYAGGANGGVWKSTNGGNSWTPMSGESTAPSLAMSSIAINPANRNIIYAGTGEHNLGSSHVGRGVMKTTNAGGSWTIVGDGDPFPVGATTTFRVLVNTAGVIWVASNQGLHRSSDGGVTWKRSKPGAGFANGTVYDLAMSADGNRMFAVVAGVGLFRSVDAGSSWTQITSGLTGVGWSSRSRLAIAKSNSNVGYLIVDPVANNAFVTTNGGSSWSPMAFVDPGPTYGGYNLEIGVDPVDANTVYVLGFSVFVNTGGTTGGGWSFVTSPHADQHAIAFGPCSAAPCPYYVGDDGGVFYVQPSGSATNVSVFSKNTNLALTEFTGGGLGINFVSEPRAIGGSQDNGTEIYTGSLQWSQTHGADGGFAYLSQGSHPNEAYSEYQQNLGFFKSFDFGSNWLNFMSGLPSLVDFYPAYTLGRADDQHLAYAGNSAVYEIIAPQSSWYQSSQAFTGNPSAIGISPSNPAVIYAGLYTGASGVIFRTASGHSGSSSTYLARSGGLSTGLVVNSIAVDATNPDVVYIGGSIFGPSGVYKTTNGGVGWTNIAGNLPSSLPIFSVITYFAGATRVIVIGTDAGVFFTTNEGSSWSALNNGLPNTKIAQLAIDRDQTTIAAFTGGRSAFATSIAGGGCTYQINPTSQSFSASAGSGSFSVTAPGGCGWTATPDASFITITSGGSGNGNGTVFYSVAANSGASRTGHINIPTQSFTINQSGANQSPVANPGGPYSGTVGVAVQFNGTNSFDPDGTITSYQWNFGDGGTGSGATPTHVYASANTYNVLLTVTDNGGATGSASTTATISASQSQTPFNGPHNIPGTTQAEDFDSGGEGIAYHDLTPGNDFGQYRFLDVDIANSSGQFNDYDVANAWAGEWLEYTVQITGGNYDIKASVASDGPGGTFHYEIDGVSKGSVTVPNTGGWGSFQLVTLPNVPLPAGQHVLRVSLDTNGGQPFPAIANINYFQFVTSGGSSSGPVGYWKFDQGSGTLAADSSVNGNNGTLTNGPTWIAGRVNNALNFDGVNDYVQVGVRSSLIVSNALTMSAWIKPASNAAGAHTILNREGEYEVSYYSGQIAWAISNSSPAWNWVFTGYSPPVGTWTHIAVTYDGSSIKTYANGVQVHSQAGSGNVVDSSPSENDFRIGSRQCSVCSEYFNGGLDEVRMYNRALSAAEILALIPPSGPAPVGYWKFDESAGTLAADSSGNGLNGTLVNGPTWMGGRVNNSLYFDGFNDYVQVGSQPALQMTNAMTAAAWIYPSSGSSTRTIVNREGEYNIGELEGVLSWAFSNTNPGWNWVSTGYSPPLFQWTHIAVTYQNGVIKTYANGVLVHTYNGSGSIVDSSTPENDFRIGSRQCGFCSEYFAGGIDEVRMYNTALSAADVQSLANPGSPPPKGAFTGSGDGWLFNELLRSVIGLTSMF